MKMTLSAKSDAQIRGAKEIVSQAISEKVVDDIDL